MSLACIGRELAGLNQGPQARDQAGLAVYRQPPRRAGGGDASADEPAVASKCLKWHRKRPDRRPLLVSLDWTKVRALHTLMAAVVVEGQGLQLQSYADKLVYKSQNALEYADAAAAWPRAAPGSSRRDPGRPGVTRRAGGRAQETGPRLPGPHQRRRDRQGRGSGPAWQPRATTDPPGRVPLPGAMSNIAPTAS